MILVSDRLAAYEQVAEALRVRLERAPVHDLNGDPDRARVLIDSLLADRGPPVIAIGPLATRAASRLSGRRPVVFCQYFHPTLADPDTGTMRGVRATPPALKQLQAWKLFDPALRRVLLLVGPEMTEFAREAAAAARRLDIALEVSEVRSDRELLYAAKHADPAVQGIWLAPDHRVLSVETLREALAFALRYGRQTLVFNRQLLAYGGLLSVEGDPKDIAERVLEQLRADGTAPRVAPLQRARVYVNLEIARRLGIEVPEALRGGTHVY